MVNLFCKFDSESLLNLFLVNVLILYPLKTLENLWFSGVFRGYKMGTLARNESKASNRASTKSILRVGTRTFMTYWSHDLTGFLTLIPNSFFLSCENSKRPRVLNVLNLYYISPLPCSDIL